MYFCPLDLFYWTCEMVCVMVCVYKYSRERINPAWFISNQCEGLLCLVFKFVFQLRRTNTALWYLSIMLWHILLFQAEPKNWGDKLTLNYNMYQWYTQWSKTTINTTVHLLLYGYYYSNTFFILKDKKSVFFM